MKHKGVIVVRMGWDVISTIICICFVIEQCIDLVQTCRHHIHHYTVIVDDTLSRIAQQEISHYINAHHPILTDAIDAIQTQFPYIKSVRAHAYADGTATLSVEGSAPDMLVNKEYLLTSNGAITYANRYTQTSCSTIPGIYLQGNDPLQAQTFMNTCAEQIDKDCLKRYDIHLIADHDIRLTPLEKPWITIICSLETFPPADLLRTSCMLCEQHMHKDTNCVVADLRFKNQIIIKNKG